MMRLNFLPVAMALLLAPDLQLLATDSKLDSDASDSAEKTAAAEKLYSGIVATNATDVKAWTKLGHAHYALNRLPEALSDFQTALKLAPGDSECLYDIASCYYMQAKYQEAADEFRDSAKAAPTNSRAFIWAGTSLEQLENYDEAAKEFKIALSMDPDSDSSCDHLAWCMIQQKRYKEAIKFLNERFSSHRADARGDFLLATALFDLHRYDDAVEYYDKSLALEPEKLYRQIGLGTALMKLGRLDRAEAALEKACRIGPQDFSAHLLHGLVLTKQLKFIEAVVDLEIARKLSTRNNEVKILLFLSYVYLAQYDKASAIYPTIFVVAAYLLLVSFLIGLSVLLTKSFKIGVVGGPGVVFSCCWILLYIEAQLACEFLTGIFHHGTAMANLSVGAMLGSVPVLAALAFAFPRQPWGIPFNWPTSMTWKQLGMAFVCLFPVMFVNGLYMVLFSVLAGHPPAPERSIKIVEEMMRSNPACSVAFVGLIGPIVEETLFRGLLFGAFEKRLGLWTIPVTAVVFAAFHLDFIYFFPLAVVGLLLGWTRWKSGSIWIPTILHIMINGLAVSVLVLKLNAGG